MALVSLLLSEGLTKLIPGAEVNANPNQPADPQIQQKYNHAAIQVSANLKSACHSALMPYSSHKAASAAAAG